MLPPSSTGPTVAAAQKIRMRCPSGRGLRTRQIALRCWLMPDIRLNTVSTNSSMLTVPSLPAWLAKLISPSSTGCAMAGGIRLSTIQLSMAWRSRPNMGKAVKIASISTKNGTMAISVVRVRLLAVSARWSSRKRCQSMSRVSRRGKSSTRCESLAFQWFSVRRICMAL